MIARNVVSRKIGVIFLHDQNARLSTRIIEIPLANRWLHSIIEAGFSSGKNGRDTAATVCRILGRNLFL